MRDFETEPLRRSETLGAWVLAGDQFPLYTVVCCDSFIRVWLRRFRNADRIQLCFTGKRPRRKDVLRVRAWRSAGGLGVLYTIYRPDNRGLRWTRPAPMAAWLRNFLQVNLSLVPEVEQEFYVSVKRPRKEKGK